MANQTVSTKVAFLTLAGTNVRVISALAPILLIALACTAQESAQQDSQTNSTAAPPLNASVTIPAGTRFALVLTNSIASKSIRRGDEIYTQTVAPILVGDQVVIPPGTFVQGKLDKLSRNGTRAQLRLQSASVVCPDGFVAKTRRADEY